METIPTTYFILMVQYDAQERWQLFHIHEELPSAIYMKKYAEKKQIENKSKEVYKIFTYKLDENA